MGKPSFMYTFLRNRAFRLSVDDQLIAVIIHQQIGTRLYILSDQLTRDKRFDRTLHEALERTRTINRVITLRHNVAARGGGEVHGQLLIAQAAVEIGLSLIHI